MLSRSAPLFFAGLFAACHGPSFDDHTVAKLDEQTWATLSVEEHGRAETKFVITSFDSKPVVAFYDSHFFTLHDEWFWFRLLNGQSAPGRPDVKPFTGPKFETVSEIYLWAKNQLVLPLDLQWVDGDRLYSPFFYELSLQRSPRSYGLGTLMHVDAKGPRVERWAFQLEFTDTLDHAELVTFFETVMPALPKNIADNLYWVVRSPQQEQLAQEIEAGSLRFHDRILRQKDLTVPGEVEVYSPGLTAGRLLRIASGESLEAARASMLLMLQDVPDYLPPASGVLTAVPQTPLAHFNLLARNRGIPNVYRGAVWEDAELETLAYYRQPVVMSARLPDQLIIKQISEGELATWQALQAKPAVAVKQIDVTALPYTYDLRAHTLDEVETLRPAFGGKAAGYLGLLAGAPEATPDAVMALSIRGYAEHMAPLKARLLTMLADPNFIGDARIRYLVLEGGAEYDALYKTDGDVALKAAFLEAHPAGNALGDFARAAGLKDAIRKLDIAPATLTDIRAALLAKFSHYGNSQGLRFRSSSTAEDVEGFNGAGLYDSNTGYFDPSFAPDPNDRKHGIDWAIKKTWASYWSFEAFEERRLESVDHLSGNMGVVVHANFEDSFEKANGVFLFTLAKDSASMELNVQDGALSVTNPTSTALPEISRVTLDAANPVTPRIERLRSSTVVAAGVQLLDDAQLLQTFARARAVATKWLEHENSLLPDGQKSHTVVLDFEFRYVHEGWPILAMGAPNPSRIVLKQTRSLEHGIRVATPEIRALPLPKDVFARSRRIERRTCVSDAFTAIIVEAFTDPLLAPDLGFSTVPFTAQVSLNLKRAFPELPREAGLIGFEHPLLASAVHPGTAGWALTVTTTPAAASAEHVSEVALRADGIWKITGASAAEGSGMTCTFEILFSTPNEFLTHLLE